MLGVLSTINVVGQVLIALGYQTPTRWLHPGSSRSRRYQVICPTRLGKNGGHFREQHVRFDL
jgi:hypothetical protein